MASSTHTSNPTASNTNDHHYHPIVYDYYPIQHSHLTKIIFFFSIDKITKFLVVVFSDIVPYDLLTLSALLLVTIVDVSIGIGFASCSMAMMFGWVYGVVVKGVLTLGSMPIACCYLFLMAVAVVVWVTFFSNMPTLTSFF